MRRSMDEKRQTKQSASDGGWRPVLRRMDQAAVAGLVLCALVGMGVYWVVQGGPRGELIEIDRAGAADGAVSGRHQQGGVAGVGASCRRWARRSRGGLWSRGWRRGGLWIMRICCACTGSGRGRWSR